LKWAVVALNHQSIQEAKKLKVAMSLGDEVSEGLDIYTLEKYLEDDVRLLVGGLKAYNKELFRDYKVIIYVMSMGIIVRDIAPLLKHKSVDPAILCLSVDGLYIIPVLSGHLGGANDVAKIIGNSIGATPVITTATDLLGKPAVDIIAKKNDLVLTSFTKAKEITAMFLKDEVIQVVSEMVEDIEGNKEQPLSGTIEGLKVECNYLEAPAGAIVIGYHKRILYNKPYVQLIPRRLVIGIGARRDTPYKQIKVLLNEVLETFNIHEDSLCKVASIDLKRDEKGIIELAKGLKVPFVTFSAEELNAVIERFEQSDFVRATTGVGAVAMPSGYLASSRGRCLMNKVAVNGITLSLWETKKES
jgi:cobalt-precorrin 5A hydrolase